MQAFAEAMGTDESRKRAYIHTLKATKLASKWADAYYWLGWSAGFYALTLSGQDEKSQKAKANLGQLMLKSYSKAEKLDSKLKPHLHLKRVEAYYLLPNQDNRKEASKLIDAHFESFPYYVAWCNKRKPGRTKASIKASLMP